jgi:hypothetical protein
MKAHEPVARVRRPAASMLDGIGDTPLIREKYISEHIRGTEGGGDATK